MIRLMGITLGFYILALILLHPFHSPLVGLELHPYLLQWLLYWHLVFDWAIDHSLAGLMVTAFFDMDVFT